MVAAYDIYVGATVINMHNIVYYLHVLGSTSCLSIIHLLNFVISDSFRIQVVFLCISWIILIDNGLLLLGVICVIISLIGFHVYFVVKSF